MPIYTTTQASGSSAITVAGLVDRVYRDYLEPADDQAVIATTPDGVTDVATTITYDPATFAPDEEDLLAPGVLIEVGLEQMRVTDVDEAGNTLTVRRGVNGTEAAAIVAGAEIRVAPLYPRHTVFDAVADNIVALYPDLHRTATQTITSATSLVEVSADIVAIRAATYVSSNMPIQTNVELLRNYPGSTTGQAIKFHGAPAGRTVYVSYEARFTRPETEDEIVGDLGVDAAWERIIVVGAAAQVLAGRELDAVTQEYITEAMQSESFPTGSAGRLRDNLLRYHAYLLEQARSSARSDRTTPVVLFQ